MYKTLIFYPFKHGYDINPIEYKTVDVVDETDAWLFLTSPTLVLVPHGHTKKLIPDQMSAIRMLDNCSFDKHGRIIGMSPAFIRANGVCYAISKLPKAKKVPPSISAQRIYKTKRDPGPLVACKTRLKSKPDASWIGKNKANWRCQSVLHTEKHKDVIKTDLQLYMNVDMCNACYHKQFVKMPTHWYSIHTVGTYFNNDFANTMLYPLFQKPLQFILQGAACADKYNFLPNCSMSILQELIFFRECILINPPLFLFVDYNDKVKKARRYWGYALGQVIYSKILEFFNARNASVLIDYLTDSAAVLCTHGYVKNTMPARLKVQSQFICNLDSVHQARNALFITATEIPMCTIVYKKDPKETDTAVFDYYCINALYLLALTTCKIYIKLTAYNVQFKINSTAQTILHPSDIETFNFKVVRAVVIYPAEKLTWRHVNYIFKHKNLESIALWGNYSAAQYGIRSPIPSFTFGSVFACLFEMFHRNVGTEKQPFLLCDVIKEPLDFMHRNDVVTKTTTDLERLEYEHWLPGKITVQSLKKNPWPPLGRMVLVESLVSSKHSKYHDLKRHKTRAHDIFNISKSIRRTLQYLRLLITKEYSIDDISN